MSDTSAFIFIHHQQGGHPIIATTEVFTSEVPGIILASSIVSLFRAAIEDPKWIAILLLENDRFFVEGWDAAMVVIGHMREIISGTVLFIRLEQES